MSGRAARKSKQKKQLRKKLRMDFITKTVTRIIIDVLGTAVGRDNASSTRAVTLMLHVD